MRRIMLLVMAAAIMAVMMGVSAATALAVQPIRVAPESAPVVVIPESRVFLLDGGTPDKQLQDNGAVDKSSALDENGRGDTVIRVDIAPFGGA